MNKEKKEMLAAMFGVAPEDITDDGMIKHNSARIAKKVITEILDEITKEHTNE